MHARNVCTLTQAVNGFGRIGRLVFRYAFDNPLLDVVHVNDLCSCESAAYLIKYNSVHGTWDKEAVALVNRSGFTVDRKVVTFTHCRDYKDANRGRMDVELVAECTGKFLKAQEELNDYFDVCGSSAWS